METWKCSTEYPITSFKAGHSRTECWCWPDLHRSDRSVCCWTFWTMLDKHRPPTVGQTSLTVGNRPYTVNPGVIFTQSTQCVNQLPAILTFVLDCVITMILGSLLWRDIAVMWHRTVDSNPMWHNSDMIVDNDISTEIQFEPGEHWRQNK